MDRALDRVLAVLRAAGGSAEQIGRMTVYVTDRRAYLASLKPLGDVHRRHMGKHFPAMTLVEVKVWWTARPGRDRGHAIL